MCFKRDVYDHMNLPLWDNKVDHDPDMEDVSTPRMLSDALQNNDNELTLNIWNRHNERGPLDHLKLGKAYNVIKVPGSLILLQQRGV